MEHWAEVRRLVLVEKLSQREVVRRTGLARDTVAKMVASERPPAYASRPRVASKLDPFRDWIVAELAKDLTLTSQRLREMAIELGYEGGRNIFDTYVREVRLKLDPPRTYQSTVYRPAELIQCDLWEPRGQVPVGWDQTRRGWVVTSQSCWSRAFAGTLIFSKEAPDILAGLARNLARIGVQPEKLVWDRESAIAGRGKWTAQNSVAGPVRSLVEALSRVGVAVSICSARTLISDLVRSPSGSIRLGDRSGRLMAETIAREGSPAIGV